MPRINLAAYMPAVAAPAAPRVDPHALDAEMEAGRNLVTAAAGAVQSAGQITYNLIRANEDGKKDMLELQLRKGREDFMSELESRNDTEFSTWDSRWQKRRGEIISAAKGPITRAGKSDVENLLKKEAMESASFIKIASLRKQAVVAKQMFDANLIEDINSGNESTAVERIAAAEQKGVISKESAQIERDTLPARIQTHRFYSMVDTNPRAALAAVRNPDDAQFAAIDAKTRHALGNVAEAAVNKERAELWKAIGRFVQNGAAPTNGTFLNLLDRAVETEPNFTQGLADALRDRAAGNWKDPDAGPGTSRAMFDDFMEHVVNFDPADHETRVRLMKNMAMMNPADSTKAGRIFSIADSAKSPLASPAFQALKASMQSGFQQGLFGQWMEGDFERDERGEVKLFKTQDGIFLRDKAGNPIPFVAGEKKQLGPPMPYQKFDVHGRAVERVNDERFREAQSRYMSTLAALAEFSAKNPDATPAQLDEYAGGLVKLYQNSTNAMGNTAIRGSKSVTVSDMLSILRAGNSEVMKGGAVPSPGYVNALPSAGSLPNSRTAAEVEAERAEAAAELSRAAAAMAKPEPEPRPGGAKSKRRKPLGMGMVSDAASELEEAGND